MQSSPAISIVVVSWDAVDGSLPLTAIDVFEFLWRKMF
jgi:hypothetical protein